VSKIEILYEDDHVIIALKPAGVLSQPDGINKHVICELVKKQKPNMSVAKGQILELNPVHRLDMPVAGPIILAKYKRAFALFSRAFTDNKIRKIYNAVVFGTPEPREATLTHYMQSLKQESSVVKISDVKKADYKESILEYKVLKTSVTREFSLVEVKLVTGRKHQIRAQLSAIGHPIVGDSKYFNIEGQNRIPFNDKELASMLKKTFMPQGEIALMCTYLSFKHPLNNGSLVEVKVDFMSLNF